LKTGWIENTPSFHFDVQCWAFNVNLPILLRHGVGIHHAGLLPKYRSLVEKTNARSLVEFGHEGAYQIEQLDLAMRFLASARC
jgi:hypothetical protein